MKKIVKFKWFKWITRNSKHCFFFFIPLGILRFDSRIYSYFLIYKLDPLYFVLISEEMDNGKLCCYTYKFYSTLIIVRKLFFSSFEVIYNCSCLENFGEHNLG